MTRKGTAVNVFGLLHNLLAVGYCFFRVVAGCCWCAESVHHYLCALVLHNPLLLVICQQVTQMKALGLKVPAVTGNAGLRSKDYSGKNRSNMQRLLG